jgi:hypothetical protein
VHRFAVTYPCGGSGHCRYERLGPACHRFRFFDWDGAELPRQYRSERLPSGGAPAIEATGQNLTTAVYAEAIQREQADWFRRASLPGDGSRTIDPARYRLKAGKARRLAGRYALCVRVGPSLLPCSRTFEHLEEANQAWRTGGTNDVYVACCSRLDRRWLLPRYNPLYAEGHPRKEGDDA